MACGDRELPFCTNWLLSPPTLSLDSPTSGQRPDPRPVTHVLFHSTSQRWGRGWRVEMLQ